MIRLHSRWILNSTFNARRLPLTDSTVATIQPNKRRRIARQTAVRFFPVEIASVLTEGRSILTQVHPLLPGGGWLVAGFATTDQVQSTP